MIEAGIFAKTFSGKNVNEVFAAVRKQGFACMHFNMSCAGLPPMPDRLEPEVIQEISQALQQHGLRMLGLSATFNMAHPQQAVRQAGIARMQLLARQAPRWGCRLLSLCTGSRHVQDKWAWHPDNESPQAWNDMLHCMQQALQLAETHDLLLGIEPELANVVSNAHKARRLLDELASPRLKIILDPANLFVKASQARIRALIDEALDLLAPELVMLHAKDRSSAGDFVAAGKGVIPFDYLLKRVQEQGLHPPLVAHGLKEAEAPEVAAFLRQLLAGSA